MTVGLVAFYSLCRSVQVNAARRESASDETNSQRVGLDGEV